MKSYATGGCTQTHSVHSYGATPVSTSFKGGGRSASNHTSWIVNCTSTYASRIRGVISSKGCTTHASVLGQSAVSKGKSNSRSSGRTGVDSTGIILITLVGSDSGKG